MAVFQKNPLTMWGKINQCWLFTYHTPIDEVRDLLPAPLELVTHRNQAFWNVVVCQVQRMRPYPLPPVVGFNYWHVAYRLYAKFELKNGQKVEGLYFLRSECNNRLMALAGNVMTNFNFHYAPIQVRRAPHRTEINLKSADYAGQVYLTGDEMHQLPPNSVFDSLQEAGDFLKYKPYGIAVDGKGQPNVVAITRDETAWHSRLVQTEIVNWDFFAGKTVTPEVCYEVEPIEYRWNKGTIYQPADLQQPLVAAVL